MNASRALQAYVDSAPSPAPADGLKVREEVFILRRNLKTGKVLEMRRVL